MLCIAQPYMNHAIAMAGIWGHVPREFACSEIESKGNF